ncbi:type I-E CRISPR-associated protein Cse2/CasB [Streptomyces lasiicapitis]|uniref:type I-E CRISPR-associated protein Cse2/CasB n=1 Tax=Streptomyces lasiicapitis TaxID=1923961 RepID=UPI00365B3B11
MTSARDNVTPSFARQAAVETIGRLQAGYRHNVAPAVAAVARLRREVGRDPHSSPTGWGLDDLEALTRIRDEAARHEDSAAESFSYAERIRREEREDREDRAVHLAVTLWALHQQSLREDPMHVSRWTLGHATRRLAEGKAGTSDRADTEDRAPTGASEKDTRHKPVPDADLSPSVRKRFVRIGTSADFDMLGVRLRELVLLLRSARIPLDYGLLADQLNRWQVAAFQADVRREWGRGFHRAYSPSTTDDGKREVPPTSSMATDAGD